jgi:hypothetical protein
VDIPDICVELHGEVISLRESLIMAHGIDSRHFFKDDVIEEEEGDENDSSGLGSAQIVITAATPMVEEPEQPFPPPPVSTLSVYNLHTFQI